MKIETIPVGPFEVNCYVAWNDSREALVIDPGADADRIENVIRRESLIIVAYLLTHGHVDHVSALAELVRAHPAPVAISPEDGEWAFTSTNQLPPYYPAPEKPTSIDRQLKDGQEWTDGGLTYRVIATPGHSPGGVSLYFPEEGVLFAGDTLFSGSVGRTDIPGGNPRTLSDSIKKLAELPPETRVFPGHGPETTIGTERRTNFFMRSAGR